MLFCIDIGNTNCIFAIYYKNTIKAQWRLSTSTARTADEYAYHITSLAKLNNIDLSGVKDCVISSVVPQSIFQIITFCRRYLNKDPFILKHDNCQLQIDLPTASELGSDRIANTLGALAQHQPPFVIIDSGTATTFDIIDKSSTFIGGIIAPGINLSIQALHMHAAKLPRIAIDRPKNLIGKNTEDAMKSGIYWGYIGLIKQFITMLSSNFSTPPLIIATGGVAVLFKDEIKEIDIFDRDLTIKGLAQFYKIISKRKANV